jgi:hypothetical protein
MKPKYVCPICNETFGRKWNLLRHGKDVHNVNVRGDERFKIKQTSQVSNTIQKRLASHFTKEAQFSISSTIRKLAKTINDITKLEALTRGTSIPEPYLPLKEFGLNHILDDYIPLPKTEIRGISAHFCEKCLTFQYTFIKDIGRDLPARKKHSTCDPTLLARAEGLPDKIRRQKLLRKESVQSLLGLVEDIFGAKLSLRAFLLEPAHINGELTEEEVPKLVQFNSTHYRIDDLYGEPWKKWLIGDAIDGNVSIDKSYLERFLERFFTTYFVVSIKNLEPWQHYIIYISDRSIFEQRTRSS